MVFTSYGFYSVVFWSFWNWRSCCVKVYFWWSHRVGAQTVLVGFHYFDAEFFYVFINIEHLILNSFNTINQMLFLLLSIWINNLYDLIPNCFNVWFKVIHLVTFFNVCFTFPHYEYFRKVQIVFKIPLAKLNLPLINHHDPLLIIMSFFIFNDSVMSIAYHRNYEIHEDHKQKYYWDYPEEEGEVKDRDWDFVEGHTWGVWFLIDV